MAMLPTRGYQPGDVLRQIDEILMSAEGSVESTLEWVFRAYNVVDGTEKPVELHVRSLSVGDCIALDGKLYKCDSFGWSEVHEVAV